MIASLNLDCDVKYPELWYSACIGKMIHASKKVLLRQ